MHASPILVNFTTPCVQFTLNVIQSQKIQFFHNLHV